jgi:predicted enzyme related to lactoylglutathione lyase
MERDEYAPGMPSWVDLGSPDIDGAADFYRGLFGWEATEPGPVEETGGYRMFEYKGRPVAGLGPQVNPGPPYWATYVTVADADDAVARVKQAGGTVFLEPMDVLDVGRMAVFADPTGAVIAIWQPRAHPGAGLVNEPNTMCWNELSTRDVPGATAFYEQVFGWTAVPQGPYNEWQLDGTTVGGMMQTPDMVPAEVPAHWLVYFAVEDTDAAVARGQELGGSVIVPPMDIQPGRFATLTDPTGAMFAVITLKAGLGA